MPCNSQAQKKLESCIDEVEALKSSLRQKQDDVESITKRQEKMVKVVTNAMNVEEQAKLTAQKQLRSAKDRVSQLDRELTDMMGKLADANERARDLQAERDDAMVRMFMYVKAQSGDYTLSLRNCPQYRILCKH